MTALFAPFYDSTHCFQQNSKDCVCRWKVTFQRTGPEMRRNMKPSDFSEKLSFWIKPNVSGYIASSYVTPKYSLVPILDRLDALLQGHSRAHLEAKSFNTLKDTHSPLLYSHGTLFHTKLTCGGWYLCPEKATGCMTCNYLLELGPGRPSAGRA